MKSEHTFPFWARDLIIGFESSPLSNPLNFSGKWGEWITFYGGNGQGKTTLLKTLCGLTHPLEGTCGIDLSHFFMGTVRPFYPTLNIKDNLQTFACMYQKKLKDEVVDFWGLEDLVDEPFQTLSDGEKQRCHLALGQLIGADVWLVDEPFLSLDAIWTQKAMDFFKNLTDQGLTLLMAQHQPNPHGQSICLSAPGGDL